MIGGIEGAWWRWLIEHIGEHLGLHGLGWLLKQRYVMLGTDLPIWVWMVLAIVVIWVLVDWILDV